nr:hypothetical protein [Tanacetum cinerariifolium]
MNPSSSKNPNDDTVDVLILMQLRLKAEVQEVLEDFAKKIGGYIDLYVLAMEKLEIFRTLMISLQDKDESSASIIIIGEEYTYGFMVRTAGELQNVEDILLRCLHINQRKLKCRAIKCIFMGYPGGVKGYILWRLDDVKPKIIIRRFVVFNESLMYKDTLKGVGVVYSRKEVEFEVELQCRTVEPTMDPHTKENPMNEDDEEPQQRNLDNYVLVHDRVKRITSIPARYKDEGNVSLSRPSGFRKEDDMVAYAFSIAEEEDTHEPITF